MEKNLHHKQINWSEEIIFGSSDPVISRTISQAVKDRILQKLAPRLYTSNLKDSPETIIRRNLYHILSEYFPGAVISHRTALEGGPSSEGIVVLTYKYTKKLLLPGIVIRLIKGEGAQEGDTPFMQNLFLASRARALLENFQSSRSRGGDSTKTLSREWIEEYLDKMCRNYSVEELNHIRNRARVLSKELKLEKEFKALEKIIGALLGTKEANILQTRAGLARAQGIPYDTKRLELFANLVANLNVEIFPERKAKSMIENTLNNLAFFESYFSNYIEGTEFEVEEAADIVFQGRLSSRPEDAHDVLGTFKLVSDLKEMYRIPNSKEELFTLLMTRHTVLMAARRDKCPGKFKTTTNRAGNTVFVIPSLVQGTLAKGFELYETVKPGIARAIFMMFLIAEVHPFLDGNGRIARIMMNAELDHEAECRIIIPTVYREDYLLTLRRLSREGDPVPYVRMMQRAQAFTNSLDFSDYQNVLAALKKSNAFLEPTEGKLKF